MQLRLYSDGGRRGAWVAAATAALGGIGFEKIIRFQNTRASDKLELHPNK